MITTPQPDHVNIQEIQMHLQEHLADIVQSYDDAIISKAIGGNIVC